MSLSLLSVVLTGLKVLPQRECDGETNDFTEPHFWYTFIATVSPIHSQNEKLPPALRAKRDEYLM